MDLGDNCYRWQIQPAKNLKLLEDVMKRYV